MRKLIGYLVFPVLIFITLSSCKKDNERIKVTRQTMNVTMKVNELYKYTIGSLCDECGLSISQQAIHYQISKITRDTVSSNLVFIYMYNPVKNYTGPDEVEIKSSAGSDGSSPNNLITLTTIKFIISN